MDGRDEDLFCPVGEVVCGDRFLSEFPVVQIGDNEFYLVFLRSQAFQIRPVISFGFGEA